MFRARSETGSDDAVRTGRVGRKATKVGIEREREEDESCRRKNWQLERFPSIYVFLQSNGKQTIKWPRMTKRSFKVRGFVIKDLCAWAAVARVRFRNRLKRFGFEAGMRGAGL